MDLIKIGKFIKNCRKDKGLTQEELSEKLNISQKTISKWECGNGLPDVSIMLDLCTALSISVNELLNGEHIDKKDYMDKAEQKLLEIQKEKVKSDKRLLTAEIILIVISMVIFLGGSIIGKILYDKGYILYGWLSIIFGILVLVPCVIFGVYIEQKAGYYQCDKCKHKFVPTYAQVLFAIHYGRTRHMKCPKCKKRSYCKKVVE